MKQRRVAADATRWSSLPAEVSSGRACRARPDMTNEPAALTRSDWLQGEANRSMLRFLLVRIASAIPVLFILSVVTFAIIQAPPGDYADYIRSQLINQGGASYAQAEAQAQAYRIEHGLDKPMVVQYVNWIGGIVTRGDFGYSMFYNKPVATSSASVCRGRCSWRSSATSSPPCSASASASGPRRANIAGSTACFRESPFSA